ncbi:MAG TPA: BON domain-containing protein [Acidimicrobiales bacterium]|nr:BON domain-containing protein [Acidimicrobiales bacterium]
MFVVRLVFFPIKLGAKTTGFAAKTGYRTGRLLGYRRLAVFGIGVFVGLLIAPGPGEELRAKLKAMFQGMQLPSDPDLGDRVRFELSHSPRTWHLPQPEVDVQEGRVVLSGDVPHATARADLEQTVTAVPGVTAVENLLTISGTNGHT